MLNRSIIYNGDEYHIGRIIKGNGHKYVEYYNVEKKKIKFYEVIDGNTQEIQDKNDLSKAIKNNYTIPDEIYE